MTDNIKHLMYIFDVARTNASKDLAISNELLEVIDELIKYTSTDSTISANELQEIIVKLLDLSGELTEKSTKTTDAINKMVGL